MDSILEEENPYNGNAKVKDVFDESWLKFAVCSTGQVSYLPFDLVGVGFYYNKDVFSKLGLNTPSTYEELVAVCKKLKGNGYEAPIGATVFADFMMASLADWNLRQYTDKIISVSGDARYDEKTMIANTEMKYDANNPSFDSLVTEDPEKMLAFTKTFNRKSAVSQRIWETYKGVAQYFQKGFTASTDADVYSQFMAQKYPIYVMGSWQVGTILGDMKKLSDDKKFNWGTFKFPSLAEPGEDFQGQPRGILIPGHRIGLAQKDDPEQTNRAADFLKYMYSPEIASKIYDITIKNGEFVQGPPLVKGVTLSGEVASYLDGFNVEGNMRQDWMNVIGATSSYFLSNEQPLYNDAKQKYVEGKINWDGFSTRLDKLLQNKVADEVKKNNYDLDSKTNDKK
jgi:raffinose/stachyose/melibiose transport system substrate-binding protein